MGMSRSAVNFLLDALLLASFAIVLWTAGVVAFVFPAPLEAQSWRLFGLGFRGWLNVHLVVLGVFAGAVLLHVILHWTWVCGFVAARLARGKGGPGAKPAALSDGVKTLYGVSLLVGVLTAMGFMLLVASLAIRRE